MDTVDIEFPPPSGLCLVLAGSAGLGFAGGQFDRLDDLRVSGAAAQIARKIILDLFLARLRLLRQQRLGHQDEARRAIAALEAAGLDESLLDGIELGRAAETSRWS